MGCKGSLVRIQSTRRISDQKISMPVNFDDLQAFLFLVVSVFIRKYQNSLE
jgi:hypothetical protein